MANAKRKKEAYAILQKEMAKHRASEWERLALYKQIALQLCENHPSTACEVLREVKNGTREISDR